MEYFRDNWVKGTTSLCVVYIWRQSRSAISNWVNLQRVKVPVRSLKLSNRDQTCLVWDSDCCVELNSAVACHVRGERSFMWWPLLQPTTQSSWESRTRWVWCPREVWDGPSAFLHIVSSHLFTLGKMGPKE